MATSAGEVEVKLTLNADDFKRMLGESQSSVSQFGGQLDALERRLLTVFSFAAIADFFKKSLDAYAENQLAITKLVQALNNQGQATQENVTHLEDLAEALAQTTGIEKDSIINAQALLTTFGITGETMDKVTKAALDLSAATGVDLQRAALLLGKAFEGQTSSLSRYGVIVNQHIELNQRFAAVMDQVNQRFGGAAAAQGDTYTGTINKMKVAFQDLQEQIGSFLAGPAAGIVRWLTDIIRLETDSLRSITQASSAFNGFGNVLKMIGIDMLHAVVDAATQLIGVLLRAVGMMPLMGNAVKTLQADLVGVNTALNNQINQWQASALAAISGESQKQQATLQTKEIVMQSVEVADKFVKDKMAEEEKIRSQILADDKKAHESFVRDFMTTEGDMWRFATSLSSGFFKSMSDGFAKQLVEGQSFAKSIKDIFKSMAEEVISYIVQIIVKLAALWALEVATGTEGLGSTIGGLRGFSGFMASGGVIAEPSVLIGLQSGRMMGVGESGPEMVVPMGKNATADEMGGMPGQGGGGGGGNITINISGQFLEADSAAWNKLMRDQIIPQIRRFTMISSTGPFNRTRGVV